MDYEADDVSYVETIVSPERHSLLGPSSRPKSSCSLLTYCVPRHGTLILRDDTSFSSSVQKYHNHTVGNLRTPTPLKREKFLSKVNTVFGLALNSISHKELNQSDFYHTINSHHRSKYSRCMDFSTNSQIGSDSNTFIDTLASSTYQKSFTSIPKKYARLRRPFTRRPTPGVHRSGLKISHHIARPYPIASTFGRSLSVLVNGIMSKNSTPLPDVKSTHAVATVRDAEPRFSWTDTTASEWPIEDNYS